MQEKMGKYHKRHHLLLSQSGQPRMLPLAEIHHRPRTSMSHATTRSTHATPPQHHNTKRDTSQTHHHHHLIASQCPHGLSLHNGRPIEAAAPRRRLREQHKARRCRHHIPLPQKPLTNLPRNLPHPPRRPPPSRTQCNLSTKGRFVARQNDS